MYLVSSYIFISVLCVVFIFGFETEFDLYIKHYLECSYFQIWYENNFTIYINEPDTWTHLILVKKGYLIVDC